MVRRRVDILRGEAARRRGWVAIDVWRIWPLMVACYAFG